MMTVALAAVLALIVATAAALLVIARCSNRDVLNHLGSPGELPRRYLLLRRFMGVSITRSRPPTRSMRQVIEDDERGRGRRTEHEHVGV